MAIVDSHRHKRWRLFLFWQSATASTSSSSSTQYIHNQSRNHSHQNGGVASSTRSSSTVSSVARSLLPKWRRLRLDPSSNLYFPYEPGKQVRSAVRIKNSSKSYIAFKVLLSRPDNIGISVIFQTTAPKSCFMRPPGGILAPGESLIAAVFKFVEHPENNEKPINQKSKVKFKIVSLKVKKGTDYVPELDYNDKLLLAWLEKIIPNWTIAFDDPYSYILIDVLDSYFDEQRDQVIVERVLRVIFLDPERANPALEKLKRQLAEADAAIETRKKAPADTNPQVVGEGLVIDEWKERREKYLARQQVEAVDSV
ncbi:hypothetical protein DH2020_033617 [Rehmannia glutinosa]|uniref:MSP domain-containing protein n=1 Tax=Rehmannia glutinosa TaxID=99300 RepID=A0ABR0VBT0_REHGL